MKQKLAAGMRAVLITIALVAAPASYAAPSHQHDAHEHAPPAKLQLDNGKKWQTDAPLRQSMANIRQAIDGSLHAIHEGRLSATGYGTLARTVESEVAAIVSNCKLEPRADAQLHLVVAELLEGAEQMAGKVKTAKRIDGAVKVVGALGKYADYFADPQFKAIAH
ncbi:MAG: hypothetical protein HYU74_13095 [Dechloromonas sp.]|nr:hypothetical protein [Dechloromonas sp.]